MASTPFYESAQIALQWLSGLLNYAKNRVDFSAITNSEEILADCREAGCDLPGLERYHAQRSAAPAFVLFGGDVELAERLTNALMLPLVFPKIQTSNVIWEVEKGLHKGWSVRFKGSDRRISETAVETFLEKSSGVRGSVMVRCVLPTQTPSQWRFVWIPQPSEHEALWEQAEGVCLLAQQLSAVVVLDDTPEALLKLLRDIGQQRWELKREALQEQEERARLESEISSLLEISPAECAVKYAGGWKWLREQCRITLQEEKDGVEKDLKEHNGRLNHAHKLLAQYQKNWIAGFSNQVKSHFSRRLKTPAAMKLMSAQDSTVNTFLQTLALGELWSRLEDFSVERLTELISGLGALAVRLELPKLELAENSSHWTADNLTATLEKALSEKEFFPQKKKGRKRLVKTISGRSSNGQNDRQNRVDMARDLSLKIITASWSQWCRQFFANMEKHIAKAVDTQIATTDKPARAYLEKRITDINTAMAALENEHNPEDEHILHFVRQSLESLAKERWLRPA
ncbi:hypothetical protein KKG05_01085 [bacterium]|nr:hypothetical protein [bacterium]